MPKEAIGFPKRDPMRTLYTALIATLLASSAAAQPPSLQVSGQTSLWRASKVVGVPVFNGQNERIGEISDLILDRTGAIREVIISLGGYPGNGERLVAVQLDVLRFPHKIAEGTAPSDPINARWFPEQAVLPTTKDALLALPEFKY
jgi:hypothetical protein